ncbi:MAG TPA: TetR/AcrR family transcriptional regulator [Streptosporangiaceae bacterium]|jgi:AcrR family transcriptional regulator|nr:TetR/AcrR family transcriptional regulator [Streptosporangiaceae bacterium]
MSADTEQTAASRGSGPRVSEPRVSERGAATRAGLLDAARAAFTSGGYAEANVTDIVAAAGASVGSLYHHFSGKADLFLTLFDEFHTRLAEGTRTAVWQRREAGCDDPKQLFLAGARAYLDGCIAERDLSALFMRGDGPPGFELVMRRRQREWAEKNAEFFARGTDPAGDPASDAVAIVLTGALMLAVAEVSLGGDVAAAQSLADRVIEVIARIDITGQS